jgi:hypothetical protein
VPAETLGNVFETTVGKPTIAGGTVTTKITCSPQAFKQCTIKLTLTTSVATAKGHHAVTIGSKTESLAIGASVSMSVSLNSSGKRLLAEHHHLKAKLTASGTIVGVIGGTIKKAAVTLKASANTHRDAR